MMGCYGIGISRVMGSIVEVSHDDKGIIWPKDVSPYDVHLIQVQGEGMDDWAKDVYEKLTQAGVSVLWDDRDVSTGAKFADADLIGISVRLVVSPKLGSGKIEAKKRNEEDVKIMGIDDVLKYFCAESCCSCKDCKAKKDCEDCC